MVSFEGDIHGHLRGCHHQHLHPSLPSPGILSLAEPVPMGTVDPQKGSAQEKVG